MWQSWGDKASSDESQPVLQLRLSRLPFLSLHSLLPTEDCHSKQKMPPRPRRSGPRGPTSVTAELHWQLRPAAASLALLGEPRQLWVQGGSPSHEHRAKSHPHSQTQGAPGKSTCTNSPGWFGRSRVPQEKTFSSQGHRTNGRPATLPVSIFI